MGLGSTASYILVFIFDYSFYLTIQVCFICFLWRLLANKFKMKYFTNLIRERFLGGGISTAIR